MTDVQQVNGSIAWQQAKAVDLALGGNKELDSHQLLNNAKSQANPQFSEVFQTEEMSKKLDKLEERRAKLEERLGKIKEGNEHAVSGKVPSEKIDATEKSLQDESALTVSSSQSMQSLRNGTQADIKEGKMDPLKVLKNESGKTLDEAIREESKRLDEIEKEVDTMKPSLLRSETSRLKSSAKELQNEGVLGDFPTNTIDVSTNRGDEMKNLAANLRGAVIPTSVSASNPDALREQGGGHGAPNLNGVGGAVQTV